MFGNLSLQSPPPPGTRPLVKDAARDYLRRRGIGGEQATNIWRDKLNRRFTSFVVSGDELLATEGVLLAPGSVFGHPGNHFRLGFGRTDMPAALERLDAFLSSVRASGPATGPPYRSNRSSGV